MPISENYVLSANSRAIWNLIAADDQSLIYLPKMPTTSKWFIFENKYAKENDKKIRYLRHHKDNTLVMYDTYIYKNNNKDEYNNRQSWSFIDNLLRSAFTRHDPSLKNPNDKDKSVYYDSGWKVNTQNKKSCIFKEQTVYSFNVN